jgi:hypothetical protein
MKSNKKKLILNFEMLIGVRSDQNITMFAYLRSLQANSDNKYSYITSCMRDNVRRNRASLLTGIDHSSAHVVGMLAEIHMREFACMMHTLNQVNRVATKYHEHAFDNTDAYIEGQTPSQTHEMNAEQRHAAQLLLGVGKSYSEINVALRILDSGSFQAAMECSPEMCAKLSQQFSANASMAEDAFDRLNHMTKHVWSLVNLLAFSNLFRFADHIVLPNPEDSIFIPYIPTQPLAAYKEPEPAKTPTHAVNFDPSRHVCNDCDKTVDTMKMHHLIISPETGATEFYLCHSCGFKRDYPDEYRQEFPDEDEDDEPAPESESESDNDDEANATYWLKTVADWTAADRTAPNRSNKSEMNAQTMNTPQEQRTYFKEIAEMLADEKITPEQACSLIEELRDAGITAEVMHSHQEQEKGFKEIAELLADRKITTEEACGLFTEWMTEWL